MSFLFHSLRAFLFAFLLTKALQHECIHDQLDFEIEVGDISHSLYSSSIHEGRLLQSQPYQGIKIIADVSTLSGASDKLKNYIINSLMPPVLNYFEAALKVPVRNALLSTGGASNICGGTVTVPSNYKTTGVDADMVIFVTGKNDPDASYVASAAACLVDAVTSRPVFAKMTYNLARVAATSSDAVRENHIMVTMHELTHALAFSGGLYNYFINPNTGKKLTGHVLTTTSMGMTAKILNLAPLTDKMRKHFGCSTLKGAIIENQGGTGSAGSHFERRVFYNEYMTASAIIDTRVTEFALALFEGSGWYQVDYTMADPITWGKNQGCGFVEGPCMDKATKQPIYDEFCPKLFQKGCSWTRRAGSSCGGFSSLTSSSLPAEMNWWGDNSIGQDPFSDNCPMQLTYSNLDCEDSRYQGKSTLEAESYGYGSKCFTGTLYPGGKLGSTYPLCFKPICNEVSPGRYTVEIQVGSSTAVCTSERAISVSGFGGVLNCPDPQEFCEQILTEGNCRRGCSARGTCFNRKCECLPGWTGYDCSKPVADQSTGYDAPTATDTNTGPVTPKNNNSINEVKLDDKGPSLIIPIVAGVAGVLVVSVGVALIVRYRINKKKALGSWGSGKPKRPANLKVSKLPIGESVNQSQNSPGASERNISLGINSGDSPLVRPTSPQTCGPSRFKNSASKATIHEPKEIAIEPKSASLPISKPPKVGDSVMLEHGATGSLTNAESAVVASQPAQSSEKISKNSL